MDRLVIFLNGDRGLAVARVLREANQGLAAVVINSKPLAEEQRIAAACEALDVPLRVVDDVNDSEFVGELAAARTELSIIAGFSTIFYEPLINAPRLGTINLHAGRLPQYRGGSPLNWQIINGEEEAGLSVIQVDAGIDTGDVLAEASLPIQPDMTIADLHDAANQRFPELVLDIVRDIDSGGERQVRSQDESQARYWHQRKDADGRIDFQRNSAREVHNLVRAVTRPYPGAFSFWGDRRVRIYATALCDLEIRGVPGRVVHLQKRGPYIVCSDRALLVTDYAVAGEGVDHLPSGVHLS